MNSRLGPVHLHRFLAAALLGAMLAGSQPSLAPVAFGQENGGMQQDDGTDQSPPETAPSEQASPEQQAPAPVADDAHWWLKRGGSGDFGTILVLPIEYQHFWQWRRQGLEERDALVFEEGLFGIELAREVAALQRFEVQGKVPVVVVENHPRIWYATEDEAVIYDPYVSRSYFVDAKTHAPLGDGPNTAPTTASVAYHMSKHLEPHDFLDWMVDDAIVINFRDPDQAAPHQAQGDQPLSDLALLDQTPQDEAPAPAADDRHWWLKRGGANNDLNVVHPLTADYARFWQYRNRALSDLDATSLEQVMVGSVLSGTQDTVRQLKAQGKTQLVQVENRPQVWYVSSDEAVIYDPYEGQSYFFDAKTRMPLNTESSFASMAYHLTRHPGSAGSMVWMVDDTMKIN